LRDSRNITAVCDDTSEIAPEQVLAARRTVAANTARLGLPASDARDLMAMLGILPGQEGEQFATYTLPQPPRSLS
jgi:hypothetical protein